MIQRNVANSDTVQVMTLDCTLASSVAVTITTAAIDIAALLSLDTQRRRRPTRTIMGAPVM